MNRLLPWLIAVAVLGGLCWLFPPFHIRSLRDVQAARESDRFNAVDYAAAFWENQLLPALDKAVEAEELLAALAENPPSVRGKFGRSVGISDSYGLFLRGTGKVIQADADQVTLAVNKGGSEADVVVPLGLVFGNALRDGTGLLNASAFPNSQEFNDLSAALNSIVETKVLPEFQRLAAVGKRLQFAGCVEVNTEDDLQPLKLVPIAVKPE